MKRTKNISGIYKITNIVNGKCYIGSSINIKKRFKAHYYVLKNNRNNSIKLQRAWNKYGESSFTFEVLLYCEKEDLVQNEQKAIDHYESATNGYNINPTAYSQLGYVHTENTKQKISKANSGKIRSDEYRVQMSIRISGDKNPNFGKVFSEEYRRRIGDAGKGRVTSEETKRKISDAMKGNQYSKGIHPSEETRQKLSKVHKGISFTEDHKDKLRITKLGERNPQYGIPISEETKQKIKDANSGEKHWSFGKHRTEEEKRKISDTLKQTFLNKRQCLLNVS